MGVTCDAGLAVARGIWRKIRTGRSVPVASQLRSHRLFSENWEHLAHLVDMATMFNTGVCAVPGNEHAHGGRNRWLVPCALQVQVATRTASQQLCCQAAQLLQLWPACMSTSIGVRCKCSMCAALESRSAEGAWHALIAGQALILIFCAGSALTSFNKGHVDLSPKVIAHRSKATRGEMLVNPSAYAEFCRKAIIHDKVQRGPNH